MKRQKRCSSGNKAYAVLYCRQHPPTWRYHIPSVALSKAAAFFSTAHCPWRTSSNCLILLPPVLSNEFCPKVSFHRGYSETAWSPRSFSHGHYSALSLWLSSTLHIFPYYPFCFWYSQPPDSSHETLYCWFPGHFCFWSTTSRLREWPYTSSTTETLSGHIQM